MKEWIVGLVAAMALPMAWSWAKKNLPKMLAGWAMKEIRLGLAGGGVEDPDVKELLKVQVMALVKFAERKLPDEGMGEQRMEMILGLMLRIPLVGAHLKGYEPQLRELIEECVKEMDAELKAFEQEEAAEKKP